MKENNRRLNSRRDVQNAVGRAQLQSKGIKIEDIAKQNIKLEDLVDHDSDLDEGLGSVSEDADDYYTTPKRTPAGKPRSGSARTPSKKGVFSTPQEATPLSLKRKRRTVSAKNYREGNTPSSEDSDVSEYDDDVARGKNSSKRPATGSPRDRAESPTPSRPRTWPGKSLSKRLSDSAAVSKESQDDFHSESYDQHRGDASSLGFYGHPRRASRPGFDDSLQVDSGFDVFDGLQSASESAFIDRLRGAAGVDSFDGLQGPSDSGSNDQVQVISTSGSNDQFPGTSDSGSYDQVQGASDSSSNGRLRGASGSGYYDRVQHLPASQLPYPIPGLAADNLDDGKLAYKHILCDLLQVPKILANSFTLEEFRIYGRAYNNEFASDLWQITAHDGKQFTCKTFRLHDYNKNKVVAHFCFYKFHMAYLAVARGDLHTNATLNRESPHIGGFWTYGDVEKDMALGVIDNPFGLHPQKIPGLENHMF